MLTALLSTYYCSPALRRSRSCGGRKSTLRLLVQSQASLPAATTPHRFTEGRAGLEPASLLNRHLLCR